MNRAISQVNSQPVASLQIVQQLIHTQIIITYYTGSKNESRKTIIREKISSKNESTEKIQLTSSRRFTRPLLILEVN